MKLTLDADPSINLIRRYDSRGIVVGERTLDRPCLVSPQAIMDDWNIDSVQSLKPEDFESILVLEPEVILLGTGAIQVFPPTALLSWCLGRRIALEAMDLGAACRTYNVLAQEDRKVVGAFVIGR